MQRILVVEDDPDLMRILTTSLEAAGYDVAAAYGGEDALSRAREHRPHLVLTDLAMPRVSGVDVIEALKSDPETASIPVIAVTAYVWDGIAQSAGQAGCDGFIAKPFSTRHLLDEVAAALREKPETLGEKSEDRSQKTEGGE